MYSLDNGATKGCCCFCLLLLLLVLLLLVLGCRRSADEVQTAVISLTESSQSFRFSGIQITLFSKGAVVVSVWSTAKLDKLADNGKPDREAELG